jgi:hypothetical protein
MSWPLIPFETCSFPEEIQKELNRRKKNVGLNYKKSDGWDKNGGEWEQYKGPMVSWIRVCSNGDGRSEINKPGFVFSGGKGFYQTYGIRWSEDSSNKQVLGFTPDGKLHTLEYDKNISNFPIHVPSPEIIRVETTIQKELYRRAWIHWKCFSAKQLEYMTPYFLVPGISVILEFGWNHFNPKSLIDLNDKTKIFDYFFKNPYPLYNEKILESNGNYDCVFGIITNFEWSVEGNQINCMTEVTSYDRLYSGIPISTIVAYKSNPTDFKPKIKFFSNIRKICGTDFIKNLKSIASCVSLNTLVGSNNELLSLIKNSKTPMKQEYWRGVFWGRDDTLIKKSDKLDFKWGKSKKGDFDEGGTQEMWINMGFVCELLNRCLPIPNPTGDSFFEVDVESSVIGAHPNHISTDGSILLIPNSIAPKYMFGTEGMKLNGPDSDYQKQYQANEKKINTKEKNKNDVLWNADFQLTEIFKQGTHPRRDDLDWIINANRYVHLSADDRQIYAFPFVNQEEIKIKNRDGVAKYDPYFYGYFKDLYLNANEFIRIVNDDNNKTITDVYNSIFESINKAAGNFWEFALMKNENTNKFTVVDKRMLPSGNNISTPWYFDYMDANQILTGLSFKPKMSDAQACRVVFGERNNPNSKTVIKEENDLLDYRFSDRIFKLRDEQEPTIVVSDQNAESPFVGQVRIMQNGQPNHSMYQFTITVDDKPYFRRLVLPDAELLNCLLDDNDIDRNQRYTGLQPITVEVSLQGLGGIRTFMTFLIRNLPDPYNHKNVAYRIVDVRHTIQDGKWDTVVKAGIIPLRGYIKQKIGITE